MGMNIPIDGIVDYSIYGTSGYRLCWILKEANNKGNGTLNLIQYLHYLPINDRVPRRVALTSAYINGENPDSVKTLGAQLLTISWININKEGGGSSSSYSKIKKAFDQNEAQLFFQIEEARPEIVIFGGTFSFFWNSLIRQGCMMRKLEFTSETIIHPYCYLDISCQYPFLFIEAYHPAYRRVKDIDYAMYISKAVHAWETGEWKLVSQWKGK